MVRLAVVLFPLAACELYCPTQEDFDITGNVQFHDNGWTMTGGGRVNGKAAFDLTGGYIEFDFDKSQVQNGVNVNLYTISPEGTPGGNNYCDIQACNDGSCPACMELDIVEVSGGCHAQTTWHTWPNKDGGCDQNGCYAQLDVGSQFHVRSEFQDDGWFRVIMNGNEAYPYNPNPSGNAQSYTGDMLRSHGGVIESSAWVGWVPDGCPQGGSLDASSYSVSNLKIEGKVIKGKEPTKCGGGPTPTPSPTPTPTPTPSPTPGSGMCCFGAAGCGADADCHADAYCGQSQDNCENNCAQHWCPSGPAPTPTPPTPPPPTPPTPTPPTPPTPSPTGCPGGSLSACMGMCPTSPAAAFRACMGVCAEECGDGSSCTGGNDGSDLPTCMSHCPTDSGFGDCVNCCSQKFPSI